MSKLLKPYYDDGKGITIYCADCNDILPHLPKVDLVLTDPPYKIGAKGGGIGARRKYLADIHGHIDGGFDVGLLRSFDNWFCFCGKNQLIEILRAAQSPERRWMLITWNKPNPTPLSNGNYLPDTEYIVHHFSANKLHGSFRDKSRFIVSPSEQNDFMHPTVKPLRVINKLIRLGTLQDEVVLDLFMGSGTTLVAAKQLGRRAIGIEIEEKYCAIAVKRLNQTRRLLFNKSVSVKKKSPRRSLL